MMLLRYASSSCSKRTAAALHPHISSSPMPCIKSCGDVPNLVQPHIQFPRDILIAMSATFPDIYAGIHIALLPDLAVGFKLCGKQVNFPIYFK